MEGVCKGLGCLLILTACSGIGIYYGEEEKQYLFQLEELKKLFCLIKSEFEYVRTPLDELFEKLEPRVDAPFQIWLADLRNKLNIRNQGRFWEIWCHTICEHLEKSRLKKADIEELKLVGKNLEYTDNISLYIEQLENKIEHVRQTYRTKTKLSRTLGIMGGVFLVILLL